MHNQRCVDAISSLQLSNPQHKTNDLARKIVNIENFQIFCICYVTSLVVYVESQTSQYKINLRCSEYIIFGRQNKKV